MKVSKIKMLIGAFTLLLVSSCQNEPITFDNFDYTTTYFSWQYPIRTIVLGEVFFYDNSNDLKHQFVIKASMGGVYANNKNIDVKYEFDPSLTDSLATLIGTDTVRLRMLPSSYYELVTNSMVIPSGSFNGGITIKLTDAFFADPLSVTTKYVLPLRILSSTTDSILKGRSSGTAFISEITSIKKDWGIDPRIVANWEVKPKNFTIFGIKYVNPFHGFYLRRGEQMDLSNNIRKFYGREKTYIEYTAYIPKLSTLSLNKLLYNDKLALTSVNFKAILEVNSDNVIITKDPTSTANVIGTGKFVKGIEEWGGKKRDAFYLNYSVTNPISNKVYQVKDTLVFRDNAISVEEFAPIILQ